MLSQSRRLRQTPFTPGVENAGVTAYTVYNRMLLPTLFRDIETDYRHLKTYVQVWDVSCQRSVEIVGPDAASLIQKLTPRNLQKMQDDQCYYVPIVDENAGMLNDPVAIKHSQDRWWLSIADSDLLLWVKGLALGAKLDVQVFEPDVSPLAVQGPKAEELMVRVFGEAVCDIRFFRYQRLAFEQMSFVVARSGYSKQGGFEIYVEGGEHAMGVWNRLFGAGADLNVRAGCPNLIERIEAGLLSYGNDMTMENSPLECGLGKYCAGPDDTIECIGQHALETERANGPSRQIRPISIQGDPVPPLHAAWDLLKDGIKVGQVSSAAWSPDFSTNVAIGMVDAEHWHAGTILEVRTPTGDRRAEVRSSFWL
ncbi:dimethylsulfoniopropionate demethylase [uncultured Erythrobacter sp.]|uniref:dimethylsulfoniopropionate demethylase n=1 Tax=uncultured Erythrobacter sp. TaxID=263913 RepID=UPI00261075F8|nr:dimethylsulfoniopropionate demethylase [uncultured Erythrobacter sp.]